MKYRNIVVEVRGEEISHYSRQITVAVPDDATLEEIEKLTSKVFEDASETLEWDFDESDGIEPSDWPELEVIEEADPTEDKTPDARLARDAQGQLVMLTE